MLNASVLLQTNSRSYYKEIANSLKRSLKLIDVFAQYID